eukprot:scaffold3670_cov124-Cylindrotheca_fusiformis.AAC.25
MPCKLTEAIKSAKKATKTPSQLSEAFKNSLDKRRSSNQSDNDTTHRTDSSVSSGEDSMEASHLTRSEQQCIEGLKDYCATSGIDFTDETIFRYACFHRFKFDQAKDAIDENRDNKFLALKMKGSVKGQFESKAFFPLLGLKTLDGSEVLYLRPSRRNPETDTSTVIESLCYVLNDMSDTEDKCRNGVAVISNLKGFTMDKFDEEAWFQFMMTMQGNLVPTRVKLFLIVNAPSWFETNVWEKVKPILSSSFSKKVHMIQTKNLSDYLMEDYQAFLPDELSHGFKDTNEIVEDYVDLKSFQDSRMST